MNEKQLEYLKLFKERLAELNIIEDINYTIIDTNDKAVTFEVKYDDNNQIDSHRITYCIMGMIYHFSNRKWITDFGYTYIIKSVQTVIFNDGTTKTN